MLAICSSAIFAEELKSEAIKSDACELISQSYQEESDIWDFPIEEAPLFSISYRDCLDMKTLVSRKKYEKLGSKKFLVSMNIEFTDGAVVCELQSKRKAYVKLNSGNQPTIVKTGWRVSELFSSSLCVAQADQALIDFDFYKSSKKNLKKIKQSKLPRNAYVPDYLQLGEPDDGAVGRDYDAYKLMKGKKVIGYILDYWYANTEGKWASQYILKYNAQGMLLNHLIEDYSQDFDDYPFFED